MHQDPKGEDGAELRVEHVLAALDQIGALCAQLRRAISAQDPKMVLGHVALDGPPQTALAGKCEPDPGGKY